MKYWIGFIGLLIGLLSPALGILFIIPAVWHQMIHKPQVIYRFFSVFFLTSIALYLLKITELIQILNLLIGTGLTCFLLFYLLNQRYLLNVVLMIVLFTNTLYIAIQRILFSTIITAQYNEALDKSIDIISRNYAEHSEQYQLFMEMVELSRDFYLKYSPGFWVCFILICLLFGFYFFSRKNVYRYQLIRYRTHIYVIYSLVIALLLALVSKWRIISLNYLIAMIPLFLLQGIAVLFVKLGKWLFYSKLIILMGIIILLINPYLLILISVVGLMDNWLDFRKLIKPEDLNENNYD